VIVRRWQAFTGKQARLEDGTAFAEREKAAQGAGGAHRAAGGLMTGGKAADAAEARQKPRRPRVAHSGSKATGAAFPATKQRRLQRKS